MAPRKAQVSSNEAADTILDYLRKQNRPYSATDISANLHNKVTKAAAQKILKDLHEGKQIEGRASGKQWVYHALQDNCQSAELDQLSNFDAVVAEHRSEASNLQATAKSLRSTLAHLNSTLSTADLISNVQSLETERDAIVSRLQGLKAGNVKKVTQREMEDMTDEWKKWSCVALKRTRVMHSLWNLIEDAVQEKEKREEVREKLGLDD